MFKFLHKVELAKKKFFDHFNDEFIKEQENNESHCLERKTMNSEFLTKENIENLEKTKRISKKKYGNNYSCEEETVFTSDSVFCVDEKNVIEKYEKELEENNIHISGNCIVKETKKENVFEKGLRKGDDDFGKGKENESTNMQCYSFQTCKSYKNEQQNEIMKNNSDIVEKEDNEKEGVGEVGTERVAGTVEEVGIEKAATEVKGEYRKRRESAKGSEAESEAEAEAKREDIEIRGIGIRQQQKIIKTEENVLLDKEVINDDIFNDTSTVYSSFENKNIIYKTILGEKIEKKEKITKQNETKYKQEQATETDLYMKKQFLDEIKERILENVSTNIVNEKYSSVIENFTRLKKNDNEYIDVCKKNVETLMNLFFQDFTDLLCNNVICSKQDLDHINHVNDLKKKYSNEINILKKKEKMLNDINERQTNQLLQLTYQMSYIKNEIDCNELNMLTEKIENMELEIAKLKEEKQKLNDLLKDKIQYMRKNFELKCYIKNLKAIINKKSLLCSNLKDEKKKLTEKVNICYENAQLAKEDAELCKRKLEEVKQKENFLLTEVKRLKRIHDVNSTTANEEIMNTKHNEQYETVNERENQKENAETFQEVENVNAIYLLNGDTASEMSKKTLIDNDMKPIESEEQQKMQNNISNSTYYELILQECQSFTLKSKTNLEMQLKEMKKLLSNEIKKNELLQKKYLNLLEKFKDVTEEKEKKKKEKCYSIDQNKPCVNDFPHDQSNMNNRKGDMSRNNDDHCEKSKTYDNKEINTVNLDLQVTYLKSEINILIQEIERMREDQLLLQKDVNNKSEIISYLIKKHALNEERFRLDDNWNMLNNKLTYEEMKKLMEETLIENIRLRTDLITLAKSVEERRDEQKLNVKKKE